MRTPKDDRVLIVPGSDLPPRSQTGAKRRVVVTGQVGLDKLELLVQVAEHAAQKWGERTLIFCVGEAMYQAAPWLKRGRILYQDRHMLDVLGSNATKDAIRAADGFDGTVVVVTHATFLWHTGALKAHRIADLRELNPDLHITVVDNVYSVAHRFKGGNHQYPLGVKDLMGWRDMEIVVAQTHAEALHGTHYGRHFIAARGADSADSLAMETIAGLIYRPKRTRVYPSFPMSHVYDLEDVLKDIDAFRRAIAAEATIFNPADVDEKLFLIAAERAHADGKATFLFKVCGNEIEFQVQDVLGIAADIDGQIIGRDLLLIDQSDFVVSYVPELPGAPDNKYGIPGLSSGVERELDYAFSSSKPVFVVWKPKKSPSPFMSQQASKILPSVEGMLAYLKAEGHIITDA